MIEPRSRLESNVHKKTTGPKDERNKSDVLVPGPKKISGHSQEDGRQDLKNAFYFQVAFNSSSASSIMVLDRLCLFKKYLTTRTKGNPMNTANGNMPITRVTRPNIKLKAKSNPVPNDCSSRSLYPFELAENAAAGV